MAPGSTLYFGPFSLDGTDDGLWCGPERCTLTVKAEAVLRYLVAHPGRLVRKADLLAAVWPNVHVSDWALTTCIHEIRHVLGDGARAPQYIATVHRQGYRFIAPVTVVATPPPLSVPAVSAASAHCPTRMRECQAALTAVALEEEHKLVTILCGPMAEAPALAARLGPEQWYRLLQSSRPGRCSIHIIVSRIRAEQPRPRRGRRSPAQSGLLPRGGARDRASRECGSSDCRSTAEARGRRSASTSSSIRAAIAHALRSRRCCRSRAARGSPPPPTGTLARRSGGRFRSAATSCSSIFVELGRATRSVQGVRALVGRLRGASRPLRRQLGPARDLYSTSQAVQDLEEVLRASTPARSTCTATRTAPTRPRRSRSATRATCAP